MTGTFERRLSRIVGAYLVLAVSLWLLKTVRPDLYALLPDWFGGLVMTGTFGAAAVVAFVHRVWWTTAGFSAMTTVVVLRTVRVIGPDETVLIYGGVSVAVTLWMVGNALSDPDEPGTDTQPS